MKTGYEQLEDWQRQLAAAIEGSEMATMSGLSHNSALIPPRGCDVYRSSSRHARLRVLQQDYPVLVRLLGETCFERIALDYVDACASEQGDLNVYGADLDVWIAQNVLGKPGFETMPWLAELTRLERVFHDSAYIHDIGERECADGASPDPMLRLHDHVRLFSSPWPVHRVWLAHRPGHEPEALSMDIAEHWLVISQTRGEYDLAETDESDWRLLAAVRDGVTLKQLVLRQSLAVQRLSELVMKRWLMLETAA